jgi:uridine monophosphate synthetase
MGFFTKLRGAAERNRSLLCVGLDPNPKQAPARYQVAGDPEGTILAWNRAVIEQTHDLVCAYKPNIAFYEALGAKGMDALRRTLALVPSHIPVLLDAKRGDIGSTAEAYARAAFEDLGVDAITLSPYLGHDSIEPFARYGDKGLFVLCHTSNPGAGEFQELEIADWRQLDREPNQPLYIHVARTATRWSPNVGLVVGATFPQAIAAVRAAAPGAWFLVPGIGAQGGDLQATLAAGLRSDGSGVLINASRNVALADDHRGAALLLRDEINAVQSQIVARGREGGAATDFPPRDSGPGSERASERVNERGSDRGSAGSSERGSAAVVAPQPEQRGQAPQRQEGATSVQELAAELYALGAVKFGSFTLASGIQSPIYVDLRLLVSKPSLLAKAAEAYASLLAEIPCERIAGVPYAALPIGTAVAIAANKPLIYPRKEAKAHGLGKLIEGAWQEGERVTVIEDLITSGGSTIQTAEQLRAAGLVVEHVIVLIDREQGGAGKLAEAGIEAHSVFKLTALLDALAAQGLLDGAKHQEVLAFLGRTQP